MKLILIVGMVLLSCFCTGEEESEHQDRHYPEGGHHGGHYRPHPYYPPYDPYHHHPYRRWKREVETPEVNVPVTDTPKIYAHEHLKPIEDILSELGQKLGPHCVAVLVCNSASNPLYYGHFGEQIIDSFSRPVPPLTINPLLDFLSSYTLAMRLQDHTLCRRNLAECSRTDLEPKTLQP